MNCCFVYVGKLLQAGQCYIARGGIQNKEGPSRWNAKAVLKTYELLSYGDIQYIFIAIPVQA